MAPSPSLLHPKTLGPSLHCCLNTSVLPCGPISAPPSPRGGDRAMYPCPTAPSSSACLVVYSFPGGLQLPHRKCLLLHKPVGKLRHGAMMAMPSLQWADLIWSCLPSLSPLPTSPPLLSPGHHPLLHHDLHPPARCHAPAVGTVAVVTRGPCTTGSGGPRQRGRQRWWLKPPRGSLFLPRGPCSSLGVGGEGSTTPA